MTAKIELKTASGGKVILDPQDTAVDATLVLPATSGTIQTSGATLTTSGNLTFTGTGNRITGDFSNATLANRVFFQNSVVNGATDVAAIPNGTSQAANFTAFGSSSDQANTTLMRIGVNSTETLINSFRTGSGTYLPMVFYTGGSERVRIDTSGNVGIGTSSPNKSSSSKVVTLNNASGYVSYEIAVGDTEAWRISSNGSAGVYDVTAGTQPRLFWTNGAERMRIDSSGNVGIGTSSPSSKLDVAGTLRLTNTSNAANYGLLSDLGGLYIQSLNSNPMYFATGGAERMRIDSSGNVGIGTSLPGAKLEVNGNIKIGADSGDNFFYTTSSGTLGFQVNTGAITFTRNNGSNESARIDSSGNLLVGTTSSTTPHTSGTVGIHLGANQIISVARTSDSLFLRRNGSNGGVARFYRDGTNVGSIDVTTTATSYVTSSDYRLKESVAPMTGALAKNELLNPVTYKWKADGSDGQGFIAHELQAVFPDAVTGEKDAVDAEGKPVYQGVDTSFLVGHLVACVKELTTELNNVKAELAAMKGSA